MQNYEQAVFISYAWGSEREEIVNQIDEALQKRGVKIIRDKRELGYKGSIKEFMERIGRGNCVIVVVSDKYLRSQNCMFELVEIAENKQFHNRIFPIVLSDANIYDPVGRVEYVKYWEDKISELNNAMKSVGQMNLQGIRDDIDQYDRIRDKISGLTSILKDMNTFTPEMHQSSNFDVLYEAIETSMKGGAATLKGVHLGRNLDSQPAPSGLDKPQAQRPHLEVNQRSLREAMISNFSLEEVQLLCSDIQQSLADHGIDLQLNLDIVGGDSKPIQVLNLITYLDRREYLSYLVEEVRRQRPALTF